MTRAGQRLGLGSILALALVGAAMPSGAQPAVPELTGRVVDGADLLRPATEASLDARLAAFEESTTVQIAVLTVRSLDGEVLEPFATHVFRTWGLGQAGADNGVLILISELDRQIRIEVGYGLEGALTDARAGRIIRNEMTPRFRAGDFDGGVLAATDAVMAAAEGTPEPIHARGPVPLVRRAFERAHPVPLGIGWMLLLALAYPFVSMGAGSLRANAVLGFGYALAGLFVCLVLGATSAVGALLVSLLLLAVATGGLSYALDVHPATRDRRAVRRRAYRIAAARHQRVHREKQALFKVARREGRTTVVYDGQTIRVPTPSSSSGSSSSSSSSSFSGGGGSSGGGGASGSW